MGRYVTKSKLLKLIEAGWEGLDYSYNNYYRYSRGGIVACCAIGAAGLAFDKESGREVRIGFARYHDPGIIRDVLPEEIKSRIYKINDESWEHNKDGFVMKSLAAKKQYILDRLEMELPEW